MRKLTIGKVLEQFRESHQKRYDYSKFEYLGDNIKSCIICSIHGEFQQTPGNHKTGIGCPICKADAVSTAKSHSQQQVISAFNKIHKDVYDYSKVRYEGDGAKVIIVCYKHGEFQQTPSNHKNGQGCPVCKSSKGETQIFNYLVENDIDFVREHKFEGFKFRYDFWIPARKIAIEYDGSQHFQSVNFGNGFTDLKKQQDVDAIKDKICEDLDIDLLRISFRNYAEIEEILRIFFNKKAI